MADITLPDEAEVRARFPVIASAAKQSRVARATLDCFAALAMTSLEAEDILFGECDR